MITNLLFKTENGHLFDITALIAILRASLLGTEPPYAISRPSPRWSPSASSWPSSSSS